jgi:hypothetical protein
VARGGVYLFAGLTPAAFIGWALWLARVRFENVREDVFFFLEACGPVAAAVALLGLLSLACACAGFVWGRPLRWWDYLIAGAAALCGAAGAFVIAAARLR